jgi:hypothetical protein
LEASYRFDCAEELRCVVFQAGYAPLLHCLRRAEVVEEHRQVRLCAGEGPETDVVVDDMMAHELELIYHGSRQGFASVLLQRLELPGDLVEACLQEKAVHWHLGFGLREVLAHPDHLVVHGRDPLRDRGLNRVKAALDGGHLLRDCAAGAVDVAAHLEAHLHLLLEVAVDALRDPAQPSNLSQVCGPLQLKELHALFHRAGPASASRVTGRRRRRLAGRAWE